MKNEYWVKERETERYCPLKIWYFDGKIVQVSIDFWTNFIGDPKATYENELVVGEFWQEDNEIRLHIFDEFQEQIYKEQK